MSDAKPKKLNSRWRKGAERYSSKRTVEDRTHKDAPTEVRYNERRHEQPGWRNGARIKTKTGD